MRYQVARDIEDALRVDLPAAAERSRFSIAAAAPPVPEDLGSELPIAIPERVGGQRYSEVLDQHSVSIDVYAATWAQAQAAANNLIGIVSALPYMDGLSAHYLETDITTLPYNNPDPRHEDIPRATFAATVICRAVTTD